MSEPYNDLPIEGDGALLAVSAQNYADADLAFWTVKQRLGPEPTPGQQAHLDQLRQRRKDTYADLVTWVMTVEAQRMGTEPPRIEPLT